MAKVPKAKVVKVVTVFCPVCAQKVVRSEFVAHAQQHLGELEGGRSQPSVMD